MCICHFSSGFNEVCGWLGIPSPFASQLILHTVSKIDPQDAIQALSLYRQRHTNRDRYKDSNDIQYVLLPCQPQPHRNLICSPFSTKKKLKERELPKFSGNKWQSWDINPNSLAPETSLSHQIIVLTQIKKCFQNFMIYYLSGRKVCIHSTNVFQIHNMLGIILVAE